ncbi:hypothetical protein GOODEAATRI_001771 [Goodea atripinnis]|uniref:Secreted protein n=1 Tax=Goodea atripinnis TaxID=208336 RepID=A0ABV0NR19_9TELE
MYLNRLPSSCLLLTLLDSMPLDLSHTPSFRAHAETLSLFQRTKPPLTTKTSRLLDLTPCRIKTLYSIVSHHSLHRFLSVLLANYLILCFSFLEG